MSGGFPMQMSGNPESASMLYTYKESTWLCFIGTETLIEAEWRIHASVI